MAGAYAGAHRPRTSFWDRQALVEIGGRGATELELALHELARKELIRPVRTSSMEGETEYSFWHVLVRDVAYSQIPRAERARRHRAAAEWIERKAGERVEDLAEVLAHHYLQALELAQVSGETAGTDEVAVPARRFLALAGERALGLDTAQAEARLRRALELSSADDPERAQVVIRWAEAAFQAGRLREAAEALDPLLRSLDRRREAEAAARALQLRSRVALRLAESGHVALAAEAVELLERHTPGPALIPAYTQLANAQSITGACAEAIASTDRARTLAKTLGLPEPARAVGYRGYARALLGDADGLAELERAVALLVEQGAGRDAAILQNNLAIARCPLQGPARSLAAFEQAIAFCAQRGLAESAGQLDASCPGLLAELGRAEEALERAARLAVALEAAGHTMGLIEVRAVEVKIRLFRGERGSLPTPADWLIETARAIGTADINAVALGSASAALMPEEAERACAVLAELERTLGVRNSPYYARELPAMLRIAVAARDSALAARLADGLELRYPLEDHALCAARAQLAEDAGDYAEAARLYAEAAARWKEFGNVPEYAHALLGEGRCQVALGRPGGERPLAEARDLFASMGYKPALAETEALLDLTAAASTS